MSGRRIFGFILVVLGLGLIFDRLGYIDFGDVINMWWPSIIILLGTVQLFKVRQWHASSIIVILIGIILLLKNIGMIDIQLSKLVWPTILLLIGLSIIFKKEVIFPRNNTDEEKLDYFTVFSGIETRVNSKQFKGGSITAVFGGVELDLREAEMDSNGASLDLTAAFGGIEIKVPEEWRVKVTGTPILGGWSNKTRGADQDDDTRPVLNITCLAVCGGVEIKD